MIRILHTSDLHIGVESYGRPDPQTGLSTRLLDFLAAFDEAVAYALDHGVDLFLFCGDAYRSRDPSQTHQREFARRIARLTQGGIPVFLLVGNHDLPNAFGRATAVEIFATLEVPKVIVAPALGTYVVGTRGGPVQIVALPWPRRSSLLSREEDKNLPLEEVNRRLEEMIARLLQAEIEGLHPDIPAIFAGHMSVGEAQYGSERTMMVGQDHVLLKSVVARPEFDYVALGHIHRHQVLSLYPPTVYCGSLQRVDFGEEGEEKGFCVVELDPSKPRGERASFRFQPVGARPFVTLEVTAEGPDPLGTVLRALERRREQIQEAIVRLHIKTTPEHVGLLPDAELRKALAGAHTIAAVTKEVRREHQVRVPGLAMESLTPLQALQAYLEAQKTPQERMQVLLEYGQRLVEGDSSP